MIKILDDLDKKWSEEGGVGASFAGELRAAIPVVEAERKELVEVLQLEISLLQAWARESREGGWSTHQVEPMNNRAKFLSSVVARVKGA